jgi:mannan polymerase complexes MNN9 subunit
MARPLGSVRLKKANSSTLLLGAVLCIFIIIFLVSPSSPASASRLSNIVSAQHHLSPPTSPYKSSRSGVQGPPPVTRYDLNKVTVTADPVKNQEHILILTPMARFYQEYWDNLLRLSYPHELITLGFILPKTKEGNQATAALQQQIQKIQNHGAEKDRFKSIIILRQDFDPAVVSQDESERHKLGNQKARREVMAKARNSLLFTTLGPSTSWVLWLDADIVESPPTLIQDLASHDKPVIVANCYQKYYDPETKKIAERPYDFNSWQDSETALKMAEQMGPDDILLEGYAELATYRTLMAYMSNPGSPKDLAVPLDGVGSTALLVKADVHRDGAMFPAFSFYHLIESEGFAKMAKRLGWQPYGLPNYKVSPSHNSLIPQRSKLT